MKKIFIYIILFLALSCNNNQDIKYYRIQKETTPLASSNSTNAKKESIQWDAPKNWIKTKGSSMRIGSFNVPFSTGQGDLSVISLEGTAGGITPNINRWRSQLNLKAHTESEIRNTLKLIKV